MTNQRIPYFHTNSNIAKSQKDKLACDIPLIYGNFERTMMMVFISKNVRNIVGMGISWGFFT